MGKLKNVITLLPAICVFLPQILSASSPSIELLFAPRANSNASTTPRSSISQRIHASLNNVLRIPIPTFGSTDGGGQPGSPPLQPGLNLLGPSSPLLTLRQQTNGVFRPPSNSNGGSQPAPPGSFLPNVNQAIHTTIAQLSTLSHWPFGYVTTVRPQQSQTNAAPIAAQFNPVPTALPVMVTEAPTAPPTPAPTTQIPTESPTTTVRSVPSTPPATILAPQSISIFQNPPLPAAPSQMRTPRPPLPNRIHNRIQSTLNFIRLPSLNQIGRPRPRPMITEPPWVTELLGPTAEPPTTRAPSIGERIHNAVNNVLLFVPATLLNFWYQNWGTQHVDRVIQQLQLVTPKPGEPVDPIFATISNQANPFANLTDEQLANINSTGYPAIAAFINNNGTLMPTIVQPVVNKTANTVEYHLRGENETTILWTGSLSNDIFFGNKKPDQFINLEDDEYENTVFKQSSSNVNLDK